MKNARLLGCFLDLIPDLFSRGFSIPRSRGRQFGCGLAAQEPHQPFQVLHRRRQVELLAHEAQPTQPQPAESDVILQLGEEGFHLPPSALRDGECWCLGQGMGTLPRWLAGVDGEAPEFASRTL